MAKLNFVIICDMAFITKETDNLNLIGVFENIVASSFPAIHPRFSVVTNIEAEENTEHDILLVVKKGEDEIIRTSGSFIGIKHRWICDFVNFRFPEAGEYIFEISLDGRPLDSTSINLTNR